MPRAGKSYAATRNEDRGIGHHDNVSQLSPWLRRRLVTEEELLRSVLAQHTPQAAEKFVQEVFWRGYFKGYLEARPSLWREYRRTVLSLQQQLNHDQSLATDYAAAIEGRTGIDCFDAWVAEVQSTGYLHNHARMWFASIWIFTLRLPWPLGADFLYRHFLDADPASNTLSWRWVAGLHTVGKHYLARAANIAACTGGRYAPQGLLEHAAPLQERLEHPQRALPRLDSQPPAGPVVLLLTEEDLHPESLGLDRHQVLGIAGARVSVDAVGHRVSAQGDAFGEGARADAMRRASEWFGQPAERLPALDGDAIAEWAERRGARVVVTACAPVGPVEEALSDAGNWLAMRKLRLMPLRRTYDARVWPHATKGFSAVRDQIPALIDALDLENRRPEQGRLDL